MSNNLDRVSEQWTPGPGFSWQRERIVANLCDAMSAVPDQLPDPGDFIEAWASLNAIESGGKSVTKRDFMATVHERYFNRDWFHTNGLEHAWQELEPAISAPEKYPRRYKAALYWLADQLRCLRDDILVIPRWIDAGVDGCDVFTYAFEPRDAPENLPTVFISVGAGGEPPYYAQLAANSIRLSGNAVRYVVVSDPNSPFCSGLSGTRHTPPRARGEVPDSEFVETYGVIFMSVLRAHLGDPRTAPEFQLVGHSAGLIPVLSAIQKLQESRSPYLAKFKGKIDMSTGSVLATRDDSKFLENAALGWDYADFNIPRVQMRKFAGKLTNDEDGIAARYGMERVRGLNFFNLGYVANLYLFGKGLGSVSQDLENVTIEVPQTYFISLQDQYVDPVTSIRNLLARTAPAVPVTLVLFDESSALSPELIADLGDRSWVRDELRAIQTEFPNLTVIDANARVGGHSLLAAAFCPWLTDAVLAGFDGTRAGIE